MVRKDEKIEEFKIKLNKKSDDSSRFLESTLGKIEEIEEVDKESLQLDDENSSSQQDHESPEQLRENEFISQQSLNS